MKPLQNIQHYLQQHNIDAAFITTPDNVFYLSNFSSNPHERLLGIMIFQQAEPFLICPKMEVPDTYVAGWAFEAIGHEDTENAWDVLKKACDARNVSLQTIAIEKDHVTVSRFEAMQQRFDATFTEIDTTLSSMRVIKNEEELQKMREAAKLADYAIEVGVHALQEGRTEMDVLNIIESAVKAKGYSMSFDTMVLAGEKTASPHGTPGNRPIRRGDVILFDLGVVYEGYCSDITRTVAFGDVTEDQAKLYDAVLRANEAAIAAVKPGVRAMELDKIARDIIEEAGYGRYFTHRLGHGLGISIHEFPSINGANDYALQPGTVFTIEPGIYKDGVAGVRIEDDVVVTKDGVEVLTHYPKALQIVPFR